MNTAIRIFVAVFLFSLPLLSGCGKSSTDSTGSGSGGNANSSDDSKRTILKVKDVEFPFRWCPPGTFTMGSPASERDRRNDEAQHSVTLSKEFLMLETPVTQEMWESVMENNPSAFKGSKKLPVENVSWNDCQEYVQKLNGLGVAPKGYRFSLPTEAQWEYACRAGTTTAYSFGDTLEKSQVAFGDSKTVEVASYPANAWGLYDMHGNVWEWCQDWYGEYPSGAVTDPVGSPNDSIVWFVAGVGSAMPGIAGLRIGATSIRRSGSATLVFVFA